MAFRTATFTLNSSLSAVQIVDAQPGDLEVWIQTNSNASPIGIGDSAVTTADDFSLLPGPGTISAATSGSSGPFHTHVRPGDELWAVSSSASNFVVTVLTRSA